MSELPEGWECTSLTDFVYSVPTGVPEFSGTRKYFSTGSINGKEYRPEGEYSYGNRPSRANRIALKNDVFQARMQNTDKALLIKDSMAGQLFSTGFLQFRPIAKTYDSKLLFYFVKSDYFLKQRDEFATGSTQIALTDTNAVNLKLLVPPLNEQRRIVTKLEKLLHKVDVCKERLEKIPTIIKRFRQAVLADACSGRLTADWRQDELCNDALPASWKWTQLENLLPKGGIFDGPFGSNLKTSDYTESGVRVIRLENIGHLEFHKDKESFISKEKYETLTKHTVREGDIIFASFIADEIKVCKLPKLQTKVIAKADCFCIGPEKDAVNTIYLTYQLASQESYDALVDDVHGATRPRINTSQLRRLNVRLCPLPEQQEIVRRVEALFKKADEIEARYQKAKVSVDKITQSILAKAFRGELVPQDPNDEPASVLLEKIKAEKARLEEAKKKGTKQKRSAK
jgi:type I restriction enzyme S subunit